MTVLHQRAIGADKIPLSRTPRLAVMGGAYGNVPALKACIAHAKARQCERLAFLGDATGFCGHSDETLEIIRRHFSIVVAGNHEKQAAAGSLECGCNYTSPEDERLGCLAHQYAMRSLTFKNKRWLATWPDTTLVQTVGGLVLLCHGSPASTNEFLYEAELCDDELNSWLDKYLVNGFACTHSGLPWVRRLAQNRFAMNCGAVGKPDHDGDTAVHYGIIEAPAAGPNGFRLTIERVEYDHLGWAEQLEREGVNDIFVEPIRTGIWTCGVASLPPGQKSGYHKQVDPRASSLAR